MAETPQQAAERLTRNLGKLVKVYPYLNMDGTLSFYNLRIHQEDGSKTFRAMAEIDGTFVMRRSEKPHQGWPLYGLASLSTSRPVFLVEGERDVDSLHAIGLAAVTSGGVNSVGSADWSPLEGHQVILWPDNDEPGRRYMDEVRVRLDTIGCTTVEQVNTDALGLPEKYDCSDWLALHPSAGADDVLALDRGERAATVTSIFPSAGPVIANDWPRLGPNALYGLAGEVVNAIAPHSEADTAALLIQFLVAIGNLLGSRPHCRVEASRHGLNLFAVLVGETAKGRKGTSWDHIRLLMSLVDPDWSANRVTGGLSSTEGLINEVRDQDAPTDKRLQIVQGEFASVLRVMGRDGNTLSATLRDAWDNGNLRTIVKTAPARATNAHISLVGHITRSELLRYLSETESVNGFANRLLFVCVRRSKCLPEGGSVPEHELERLAARISAVDNWTRRTGSDLVFQRDAEARDLWRMIYATLSAGQPGLLGAATGRAESQVLRLSAIYAALDESSVVRVEHLMAALAVWDYCFQSASYIFGDAIGDAVADRIREALASAGNTGLTRTEIRDLFKRNVSSDRIEQALHLLSAFGMAMCGTADSGGRPTEVWSATT